MNSSFWTGAGCAIAFFFLLRAAVVVYYKQGTAFKRWYKGLPPRQWLGVGLILLGLKITNMRYCKVMEAQDRLWLSPLTFIMKNE